MKRFMYKLKKMHMAALGLAFLCGTANATVYTAALSGPFASAATWGGIAPASLLTADVVIIPAGVNVSLTGLQTLSGTTSLIVNGTLSSTTSGALVLTSGSLAGAGNISVDSLAFGLTSGFSFTGTIAARKLSTTGATIATAANVTVNNALHLTAGTLNVAAGTLIMGNNSKITLSGGAMSTSGTGITSLDSAYDVTYTTVSATSGAELTGSGLTNLALNTPGTVSMATNAAVKGTLTLTAGMLSLNGRTLTFNTTGNLASSGTGSIMGSTASSIVVNSTAGLTGALRFAAGSNMLNNLTINTGSGSSVALGSDLSIAGMATLTAGTLALSGYDLVLASGSNLAASGTGTISGNVLSDITVNATAGLTGALRFATAANTIGNLIINTAGNVSLGSDLNTNGMMTLTAGTLSLNGNTLTFTPAGNLSAAGTGTIMGSTTSNIVVNSTAGLTGMLRFATGGNTLNNLTVNTGSAGNVSLGSDLNANGMVTLTAGTLSLNGRTLTFNTAGNLAATGTGTIMGSTTSNIIVNSTAGLTGTLRFATGGNMLNDLTVNTATASSVMLGTDLMLYGMATLTSGSLALNAHHLVMATGSNLSAAGSGTITGHALSDITVNATAGLTGALRFAPGANTIHDLMINTGSAGNVALGSDLNINGTVTLMAGTLSLNGGTLTFATTGNLASSGTGTIIGSTTSSIVVNSTAGLTGALRFAAASGMLNNLTINTAAGSMAALGSDLAISGVMTLTAGSLSINGHTLTINPSGNLAASGTGAIMGSTASNLVINSTAGLSGALRFAAGGNNLNDLTINTGAGSITSLATDLWVNGILNLQSGKVILGTSNLGITAVGTVTGGSSSSYVITNGTGKMVMNMAAATIRTFAVGTSVNYAPMAITANAGSATGDVSINVADGVLSGGTTGSLLSATQPVVNATWFVSSSASGAINYNMTAMWSAGMEVNSFNRNKAYISHYTGGAWDVQAASAATASGSMYIMSRAGVTSLSPFMVAQEATSTNAPVVIAEQPAITVYPNPTTNTLHFTATAGIESVSICDMVGKCILSAQVVNDAVDVSTLPTGNYVIRFTGKDINVAKQFVKQ